MTPDLLLEQFHRLAEAPDAISRLRRFILDLAVRGKLVEQDPRDEPADKLIERVQADRALRRQGKSGEDSSLTDLADQQRQVTLPFGWRWVRFGQLINSADAGWSPKSEGFPRTGDKWGVLKVSAVSWGRFLPHENKQLLPGVSPRVAAEVHSGDFLISRANTSELVAKCVVVEDAPRKLILSDKIVRLQISQYCDKEFLKLVNNHAEHARAYYAREASGTSLSMKNVSRAVIYALLVPLAPLAEQHRIVAKVDELMALCDRLAAAQAERESRRDRLVAASLHRLHNGEDADDFGEHSRFHLRHLPRLTTRPEHISQLRQTILNLAVRGRLVAQDSDDEPASVLVERIRGERVRLLKDGKITRTMLPIPAEADDLAFQLRPGWKATTISEILVELVTGPFGSSLHQSDYYRGGVPVINPASIKPEGLVPIDSMAVAPPTILRLASFKLRARDIVMARRGEMGRCAVVTEKEDGWLCGTGSLILRLPECVFPRFLVTLIGSPFVREYLGGSAVGSTMQNLNQSILLSLVVGLPPLAEQHRIVTKVDELMAVCTRLEAQLSTVDIESRGLLDAVLHDATRARSGHRAEE